MTDVASPAGPGIEGASTSLTRGVFWVAVAAIFLVATILRIPTLATRPLWLDETYSAWFSALSLHELWSEFPDMKPIRRYIIRYSKGGGCFSVQASPACEASLCFQALRPSFSSRSQDAC